MKISTLAALALTLAISSAAWADDIGLQVNGRTDAAPAPAGPAVAPAPIAPGVPAAKTDEAKPEEKKTPVEQTLVSPDAAMKVDQADEIKKLIGENPPAAPGDIMKKLDEVLDRMGSSEDLLKKQDPGEVTQETQHRITADLDILIEEAKKAEAQSQSGQGKPQPQKDKPGEKQMSKSQKGKSQTGNGNEAATESTLRDGTAEAAPGDPDLREVKNDRWANLPPRKRAKITNAMKSDVLPEYKDDMDKFFDELARANRPH